MNEKNLPESVPKYTLEDFDRERGEAESSKYLNNLHLNLPLHGEQAMNRNLVRDIESDETDLEIKKIAENYKKVFEAIDAYCQENNIEFGEEEKASDMATNRQEFLIDLYIYLRNKGFAHQEITK